MKKKNKKVKSMPVKNTDYDRFILLSDVHSIILENTDLMLDLIESISYCEDCYKEEIKK